MMTLSFILWSYRSQTKNDSPAQKRKSVIKPYIINFTRNTQTNDVNFKVRATRASTSLFFRTRIK